MTKINVVYAGDMLHGMIGNELVDIFKEQRNIKKDSYYTVRQIDRDKVTDHVFESLRDKQAFVSSGEYVMFPSEEEYMLLSLDQFLSEMQDVFKQGIELLPYLKLTPEENHVVHEYLYDCYLRLKESLPEFDEDGEEDWEMADQMSALDRRYMEAWILGLVDKTVRREL